MKAGRELDALVDEKVMGHKWPENRCRWCGWTLTESIDDGCVKGNCSMRPLPDPPVAERIAPYSTDIAAAWQVVEKLKADGWQPFVGTIYDDAGHRWQCNVTKWDKIGDDGSDWRVRHDWNERADTAPLAICLAALKAMEG